MSGETSKLTSASKGGEQKKLSGQSRCEDIATWRQSIRQQYPELTQGTHFVPPLHFLLGDYAGSSTHRFPSFPISTPSGSKFTKPSEKKLPDTYEERMLTSSVPESGVLDGQQRFLYGLHDLAERTYEVMMVLSQMKFGQYVNKPSYAAAADTFLGHSVNIKERTSGETDVLIINKQYGLITGEIRDVQMTEHGKDVSILVTIQEAITKLNESEGVLKQLVSFMPDVNVTKTLILPSITSDQLSRALSKDVKTQEDLCRCLGVKTLTLTEALELCLLAEDTAPSVSKLKARPGSLTQMESWWLRLLKQTGYKVDMMDSEYVHLVAMFCGPATTVQLHLVTPPRLGFQTETPIGEKPYTGIGEKAYTDTGEKPFTNIGEKPYKYIGEETYTDIGEKPYTDIGEKPYKYIEEKPYTDIGESPYTYTGEKSYTDTGEIPIKYFGGKPYTDTSEGKDTPAVKKSRIFHRPRRKFDDDEFDDDDFIDQTFHTDLIQSYHSGEADSHPEPVSSEAVGHAEPITSETVSHPEPVSSDIGNTNDPMSGESPSIKPIFSETWQMCQTFTSSTGQMQGKDSDIVLFVPEGAIDQQDEVIVHGAVCTDLKAVHLELRLEDSETIVSPVVEYHTDHLGEFQKPVNIYLPLFIPSPTNHADSLRVYRFFKTENGSVDKEQLPYKTLEEEKTAGKSGKENESFFYLTETRQICVVALHFCGFVCSCCNREIKPGPLCLRLYGVHRQRRQREAIISLYVWDERLAITDFEKKHVCGQEQDLKFIIEDSLDPVPSDANLEFGACLELNEEDEEIWKHREKKTGFQMLPSEARRTLQSMFVCSPTGVILSDDAEQPKQGNFNTNRCYERKPVRIHWSLENKPGYKPDTWFRCAVQAGYVKGDKHMQFLEIPQSRTLSVFGLELEKQPNANAGIQTESDPCSMTHVKELNNRHPIIEPTAVPTPVHTSFEPIVSTQVHSNTVPNVDSMPHNIVNDLLVDAASRFQTTATNHSHTTIQFNTIKNYVTANIKRVKGSVDLACNRTSETSNARDSPRGLCGSSSTSNACDSPRELCGPNLTSNTCDSPRLFDPAFLTVQPKNTQSVAMGYTERFGEIPEDTELEALKDQKRNEIFDVSNASSVTQIHSFRRDRNYPKPVFCEDWQTSKLFSSEGGLLQRQQSDVILYIPDNALEEGDEVIIKGAVCTDLKTVHLALALDNTETIVSPVAEFCTDQNQEFKVPVLIYLPHFIPSVHLSECVNVYHFHKNETGSIKVVKLQQKSLTKMRKSPRDTDRNDYFYFTENHHICINTCHFSGFVCTCTHELKPVPLDLHLYGVHRQRRRREVHISLYVWDGRLRIKDFEKEIVIGQEAELKLITAHRLDPVENNSEVELGALVELSEEDEEVWMHSEIRNGQKFPVEARRKLENIFVCQARPLQAYVRAECPSQGEQVDEFCCYDRKPLRIDWELRNKPGCIPDVWFDSAVLVGYVKNVEKNINFLDNPRHLVLNVAGLKLETQPDKTTQTDIDTAQETYVKKLSEPVRAPSFSSTEDDLRDYCSNININIGNITGKMSLSNVSGTQTGRELQPEQKFKSTGLCPVMSTEETTCKIANSPLKDEFEANFTTMNVPTARSPLDERSTVISSQTQEPAGQEEELGAVGGSSPEIFESRGTPEEFYVNSNENRTCKRSNLPTSNNVFKTGIRSTDASNRGVNTTGPKRTRVSCKGIDCFVENSRTSQANEETLNPNPECVNQENHLRTLLRNEILKPPVQCEDSLRPTTETHE